MVKLMEVFGLQVYLDIFSCTIFPEASWRQTEGADFHSLVRRKSFTEVFSSEEIDEKTMFLILIVMNFPRDEVSFFSDFLVIS